jgi:hypothetical protein
MTSMTVQNTINTVGMQVFSPQPKMVVLAP